MKGQIIGGTFGNLIARQKIGNNFEIGELLIAENDDQKVLLQVTDLSFASQISQSNLELISGLRLEQDLDAKFMDEELRLYSLATLKSLVTIKGVTKSAKILPPFFSSLREVTKSDLNFKKPASSFFIGNLRSGSKELNCPIFLDGKKVLSHHVLIPATTGRGKSNLTSVILWSILEGDYAGMLVLDPHDEYYERLKTHPKKDNLMYYTPSGVPPGANTLKINTRIIRPEHFNGVLEWSLAQRECLSLAYKKYGSDWISALLKMDAMENIHETTLAVVKRRLSDLLDIEFIDGNMVTDGIFDANAAGKTTVGDIARSISEAKTVIINTSGCSGKSEILVGSLITTEIFRMYKHYKLKGQLDDKPVVSIVLEEAPRVLGKEVLEKGSNIFSTIAREGRKFKVGLIAITQLPSLIPRQILANMNTKIILGIEMAPERQAVIESASQDLSDDNRNIASLDKGEAIITSNFVPFAMPVTIPLFSNYSQPKEPVKNAFAGVNLG